MISKDDVRKCAKLARIRLSNEEIDLMSVQLIKIVEMIEELDNVNTADVVPLTSVLKTHQRLRVDQVTTSNLQAQLFANVSGNSADFAKQINCYIVPKVVE